MNSCSFHQEKVAYKSVGEKYFQSFSFPVNTFPSAMHIKVDGHDLTAGTDYIVSPASGGSNGMFEFDYADSITFMEKFSLTSEKCVVLDNSLFSKNQNKLTNILSQKKNGAVVLLEEKKQ